jgi:predicted lipoprotein with Yx(FWY)xxD motif
VTDHHGRLAGSLLLSVGLLAAAASAPALAASHAGNAQARAAKHHGTQITTVKTSLGRVVSNHKGRVMFRFLKDGHNVSKCKGQCPSVWPAVMSKGKARAGAHIKKGHLGRTSKGQVTYHGHPLYYYVADPKPGKTHGDGIREFGAHWYVVSPAGKSVKPKKSSAAKGGTKVTTGKVGSTTVLTSANGHTLYELSSEQDYPPMFTCTGACTSIWPPLLTKGAPTASGHAMASLLGTVTRPDGTTQVTYNHHPLYDYIRDTSAGTAKGEGVHDPPGTWHDMTPNGSPN